MGRRDLERRERHASKSRRSSSSVSAFLHGVGLLKTVLIPHAARVHAGASKQDEYRGVVEPRGEQRAKPSAEDEGAQS